MSGQRPLRGGARPDGLGGGGENEQEAVSPLRRFRSSFPGHSFPEQVGLGREDFAVSFAELLHKSGRALHIGEEKGNGAPR
jgi:hypothetical protein